MTDTNAIHITASLVKREVKRLGLEKAEDILRAAMKEVQTEGSGWMVGSENDKIMSAVVASMSLMKEEDKKRLKKELDFFKSLGAASDGVPVDFASLMEQMGEFEPIGIRKIWEGTKSG